MRFTNILETIRKDISKVNQIKESNKDEPQTSLQQKAKRLLIGFFVLMFALTVLSKAADSITIAQVTTQPPKGSVLTFVANGTGTITADAKKYVKVMEGIGVDKINVKVGQEVKKGDLLVILDPSDIADALETANREADKLKNQMEQEELSTTESQLPTKDKAKFAYESAKQDLESAEEDLKEAKKTYKEKAIEKKTAETDYKNALTKNINQIYSDKTDELKEAKASYESVSLANEESLNTALEAIRDAKNTLDALQEKDTNIRSNLETYNAYQNSDKDIAEEAINHLILAAFGDDSDAFDKYKDDKEALETKVSRANDDYIQAQNMGSENYENAVTAAKRAVQDAKKELAIYCKKENLIRLYVTKYTTAISNNNSQDVDNAVTGLYQSIYGTTGYKKHLNDLAAAQDKLSQATSQHDALQKKNTIALSVEQDKIDKIQKVLTSIDDGTYDSNSAAEAEKQTAQAAKQEMETQKQTIRTANKVIQTAKRGMNSSKFDYEQAILQDNKSKETEAKQVEASNLRVSSALLDLQAKLEQVDDLKALQQNKGKIKAEVTGTVDSITLEAGKKTTADTSIIINTGSFGILVTVPNEQGEYVSIGDEIKLTAKGKKDDIKVNVEGIRFTTDSQQNEIAEITAIMPKGDYIPGATLTASITKNSDLYDVCIPLTAVRSDGAGSYCLITQTRNTVLGDELLTVKVPIQVIEKDATLAAVNGALSKEDNVIISSNKNVSEGNRVRLKQ